MSDDAKPLEGLWIVTLYAFGGGAASLMAAWHHEPVAMSICAAVSWGAFWLRGVLVDD